MLTLGLTGSIGMGKSATADMFRAEGIPVFDADACVHALQAANGPALPAIEAAFPGTVKHGVLDRQTLGTVVFADQQKLKQLEAIMHPLVAAARTDFLANNRAAGAALVVLDEPLLFEMGNAGACDHIVVVSADPGVQRERVMARPGMTAAKFDAIISQQMSDSAKRAGADSIIPTDQGFDVAAKAVKQLLSKLTGPR